jgi:tetratricopeptide (TPR) repeat protein
MRKWFVVAAVVLSACSSPNGGSAPPAAETAAPAPATLKPTSKSPEAIAHFEKGEALLDNLRTAEAADEFAEALKLDPDFILARAYHGQATPGPDGLEEMESAAAAASSLTEAERLLIEGMVTNRRGEFAASREALTKLTTVVPGEWRAHYLLGFRLLNDEKYPEAVQALRKATELNPKAGGAHNMLGYAALRQGDVDGAIAAFNGYVSAIPQEPNPQDSLGEALLAAGRFAEAEAAFTKAAELAPSFWNAHEGVAYAKYYAGDYAGARAALGKALETATRPGDKVAVQSLMSAMAAGQGNTAEAVKMLDAAEKIPGAQPLDLAFVAVNRAMTAVAARRYPEALKQASAALQQADSGQFPAGASANLRRVALRARITAESRMGNAAAAEKTAEALAQVAASRTDDLAAQGAMHYGRGMVAMAKGDAAAARAAFEQCTSDDDFCRGQLVAAAEKAGDAAGAAAAKDRLLKLYVRDPVHLVVRSGLAKPARTT